jgi:carbamate kinase
MPNAELLLKEAERLSPEYFAELLDFARFLSQKYEQSSVEEWPDYWAEAENAKAGSVKPKLYSATEFIEKHSFIVARIF